jgi:chemotaxis protein CheX
MNVKFMNPFVEAAVEVLKAEVGLECERGKLSLQKSAMTTNDITVLLNLVGDLQGVVLYGLSKDTALKMVSNIMGQTFDDFDNLAQSGIAELGNVITGSATVKLSATGFKAMISPPTLVTGRGVQISTLDFPRIVVPLTTDAGEIVIHLSIRETPPGASSDFIPITVE